MTGYANKVIASKPDLGLRTVERVRNSIFEQLGCEGINELLLTYAGISSTDESETAPSKLRVSPSCSMVFDQRRAMRPGSARLLKRFWTYQPATLTVIMQMSL